MATTVKVMVTLPFAGMLNGDAVTDVAVATQVGERHAAPPRVIVEPADDRVVGRFTERVTPVSAVPSALDTTAV
jgi:hypothetical protein